MMKTIDHIGAIVALAGAIATTLLGHPSHAATFVGLAVLLKLQAMDA